MNSSSESAHSCLNLAHTPVQQQDSKQSAVSYSVCPKLVPKPRTCMCNCKTACRVCSHTPFATRALPHCLCQGERRSALDILEQGVALRSALTLALAVWKCAWGKWSVGVRLGCRAYGERIEGQGRALRGQVAWGGDTDVVQGLLGECVVLRSLCRVYDRVDRTRLRIKGLPLKRPNGPFEMAQRATLGVHSPSALNVYSLSASLSVMSCPRSPWTTSLSPPQATWPLSSRPLMLSKVSHMILNPVCRSERGALPHTSWPPGL